MRIVDNTPSDLRLEETSGRLPVILLGVAAIIAIAVLCSRADLRQLVNAALFAAAAVFFRRISRIDLEKAGRVVRIARVDMWRRSSHTVSFDDIRDVQVEVMRPETSVQHHTRLTLATKDGPVPLTAGFRADLEAHLALRKAMVEVIFSGRLQPAPLDAAQVLAGGASAGSGSAKAVPA